MKYLKFAIFSLIFICISFGPASGQSEKKVKRPVKNPPQYPHIIDLDDKAKPDAQEKDDPAVAAQAEAQTEAMVRAISMLTDEMKALSRELRALNLRQQSQLEVLRMTRIDMRIDHYERELRPVRDRIAALEIDDQNLIQLMTPESLLAQVANIPTFSRDKTIEQMRSNHEARLNLVRAEKERLRTVEADLVKSLETLQKLSAESAKRVQDAENQLRMIEMQNQPVESGKEDSKPDGIPPGI